MVASSIIYTVYHSGDGGWGSVASFYSTVREAIFTESCFPGLGSKCSVFPVVRVANIPHLDYIISNLNKKCKYTIVCCYFCR